VPLAVRLGVDDAVVVVLGPSVVRKLSVVVAAVGVGEPASSVEDALVEVPLVSVSVRVDVDAPPVREALAPLADVPEEREREREKVRGGAEFPPIIRADLLVAIEPLHHALPVHRAVLEVPLEAALVHEHSRAAPVLLAVPVPVRS
jgi:hypothetical protein